MSKFLCKPILLKGFRVRTLALTIDLCVRQNPNVGPLRWFSISSKEQSFTVSYLIRSLGFSPKQALLASKQVKFNSPVKPDKVISLLKKHGFTEYQISRICKSRPSLLTSNWERTILPKLEFFKAKGLPWPEFSRRLCLFPSVLHCSLANKIIPTYEFFRNVFHSDQDLIVAVSRFPDLLVPDVDTYFKPNIAILRKHGVSDSNIATLIRAYPMTLMVSSHKFHKVVDQVSKIGFSAEMVSFVVAVSAYRSMRESTWETKISAYKKWGFSEEEVLKLFVRNPLIMKISADKISSCLDFLVNEVGLSSSCVASLPQLLGLSLKKRLIPRHFVLQALLSKGLVKKYSVQTLFGSTENKFLQKFVMPYVEKGKAPELLELYMEKLNGLSKVPEIIKV